MIASMTGFGRGEITENGLTVLVEIRSLNHRFLDIEVRLPKNLSCFEKEVKDAIAARLSRGRVSISISVKGEHVPPAALTIDRSLAQTYRKLLDELKEELNLEGSVKLEQLLNFPDIITTEAVEDFDTSVWDTVKKGVDAALEDLVTMRRREGEEIQKDLKARIALIDSLVKHIEARTKHTSEELYRKLKARVKELAAADILNEGRLETEVALLAEKADVTEECIRFKSHNTLFLELLRNGTSEGRKLNFLLQEMHREANTIGAKASDAQIAHWVVEIKEEVEKLREQVQNIE